MTQSPKDYFVDQIKKINACWLSGNPEDLAKYFHENIIIVSPDLQIMGEGKDNCIKSYLDFLASSNILSYSENVVEVNDYENTAAVFLSFSISWEIGGERNEEEGKELYIFSRENDDWKLVLRKLT